MIKNILLLTLGMGIPPCTGMAQEPPAVVATAALTAEQQATVHRHMQEYLHVVNTAKEVVLTIRDKESASAMAPKLKGLLQKMDAACDALELWASKEGVADAVDSMLVEHYKDKMGALDELDRVLTELAGLEEPFYGASDLEAVLFDDDDAGVEGEFTESEVPAPDAPAALTPEQMEYADAIYEHDTQALQDITDALRDIKDKRTADAAAPKLRIFMGRLQASAVKTKGWAEAEGITLALQQYLLQKPDQTAEMKGILDSLLHQDIPYYGSMELMDVLYPSK